MQKGHGRIDGKPPLTRLIKAGGPLIIHIRENPSIELS
jgi:hypothetical protein